LKIRRPSPPAHSRDGCVGLLLARRHSTSINTRFKKDRSSELLIEIGFARLTVQ
jgi:hypothetical protein